MRYESPPEHYPYVQPQVEPPPAGDRQAQLTHPPVKKKSRLRRLLPYVIASVVAIPLGGYGGLTIGRLWGAIPNGPIDTPVVVAAFPNQSDRYLHGVTVSSISEEWLAGKKSWKCEVTTSSDSSVSEARKSTGCAPAGKTADDLRVTILYDDEKRVRSVNLLCAYGPGDPTCRALFTDLTSVVMARDERLRSRAVDWARANVDSDESIVIGTIRMAATLSPHYLEFTPEG